MRARILQQLKQTLRDSTSTPGIEDCHDEKKGQRALPLFTCFVQ
jgi:hypothetical protein